MHSFPSARDQESEYTTLNIGFCSLCSPSIKKYDSCIGQKFALLEEKAIVSMVIRELKMEADPTQKIACDPALVSRPVGGLRMKIRKREDYKM